MTAFEVRAHSEVTCQTLWRFVHDRQHIASYLAFDQEVDLSALHEHCWAAGKNLYFPRIDDDTQMTFCAATGVSDLQPGRFGILEATGPAVELGTLDLVLVPGVAFDKKLRRLGLGGGFYDRLLQQMKETNSPQAAPLIGVGYNWQISRVPLPVEPHDILLDQLVTERETLP